MTNDDILRMAHLAGYIGSYADGGRGEQRFNFSKEQLIEFATLVAAHQREQDAQLVQEMVKKNYDLDDFANSVRAGMMRLCSDGRPKWLKISMEVAAEREACAKECETLLPSQRIFDQRYYEAVEDCAATIRARGEV